MKQNLKYPLVRLPQETDLILYLICEELKSKRLAQGLDQAGFDYSPFQPHLDSAILAALGMTDERNETYDFYYSVIAEHAKKLEPENDSVIREALEVYQILVAKGRRNK